MPSRERVVLLIGRGGQVGRALERVLAPLGPVLAADRRALDLADPAAIRAVIRETRPWLVVNAAAYTAVDRAEGDEQSATRINADAPALMAAECRRLGAPFVHFSTDYVFDGAKRVPYVETDAAGPLNAYGRSKLAGERAVLTSGAAALVFRLGWVYDLEARNFLTTMRRLAAERESIDVVGDQIGIPTWSGAVAGAVEQVAEQLRAQEHDPSWLAQRAGLYHLSGSGTASWADFAAEVLRVIPVPGREHVVVTPIATSQFPAPARRPSWSVLDSAKVHETFGIALPHWREQLRLCAASAAITPASGG